MTPGVGDDACVVTDCLHGPMAIAVAEEGIEQTNSERVIAEKPGVKICEPTRWWAEEPAVTAKIPIEMRRGRIIDSVEGTGVF